LRFLLTCRQVYYEAAKVALSNTTFSLDTKFTVFFIQKLSSLPRRKVQAIKHLELHGKLIYHQYLLDEKSEPGLFYFQLENFGIRLESVTVRYKWAPLSLPLEPRNFTQTFMVEAFRNYEILFMVFGMLSVKTVTISITKGIPEGALEAMRKALVVLLNPWKPLVAREPFYDHGEALLRTRLLAGQYLERLLSPAVRPKPLGFEVGRIRGSLTDDAVKFVVKFRQWWGCVSMRREVTFIAVKDDSWTGE
jgi:hypothetical protein